MEEGCRTEQASGGEEVTLGVASSSLGTVLVGVTRKGIRFVRIGDDDDALREDLSRDDERAVIMAESVARLIDGSADAVDAPLDIRGTAFQQTVWQALREIPAGSTVTYAGLAERIGRPSAARAVARACATNDLAVVIPCHRVVRSDGNLAGYRWGVERKRALLEREGRAFQQNGPNQ